MSPNASKRLKRLIGAQKDYGDHFKKVSDWYSKKNIFSCTPLGFIPVLSQLSHSFFHFFFSSASDLYFSPILIHSITQIPLNFLSQIVPTSCIPKFSYPDLFILFPHNFPLKWKAVSRKLSIHFLYLEMATALKYFCITLHC